MPKATKKHSNQIKCRSKVWLSPGMNVWHFVSLPKKQSKDIMNFFHGLTHGFSSLPVNALIGNTKWKTSIFFDNRTDSFILPLKKKVRKNENIKDGDIINLSLIILV